jgi:hypothetical protein
LAQLAIPSSSNVCQLCNMMGHNVFPSWKLFKKPNVVNAKGGIKQKTMDLNVHIILD